MAGGRSKYYRHLRDWYRATRGNRAEVNGITGPSIGRNRELKVTVDLADTLIDAGYQLHIDAARENVGESPSEIVVPLTTNGAGSSHLGRYFISNFTYRM